MNELSDSNAKTKLHAPQRNICYYIDRGILTGVSNGVRRTFMIWLKTRIIYKILGLFMIQACGTDMTDRYRSIL